MTGQVQNACEALAVILLTLTASVAYVYGFGSCGPKATNEAETKMAVIYASQPFVGPKTPYFDEAQVGP